MTVLSRVSVHLGPHRGHGVRRVEELHTRKTDDTEEDRGASVDLRDRSRPTSSQHHSSLPNGGKKKKKKCKIEKIIIIWHRTPATSANTKIENQRQTSECLSD